MHKNQAVWTLGKLALCIPSGASAYAQFWNTIVVDKEPRYNFPTRTAPGEVIDLTADERPFYFNPYSGELSLDFPRTERTCRGGILA